MVDPIGETAEPLGAQSAESGPVLPVPVEAVGLGGDADVLARAKELYAEEDCRRNAIEWGAGFEGSEEYRVACVTDITELGSSETLLSLIQRKQKSSAGERISQTRLQAFAEAVPELREDAKFQELLSVAREHIVDGLHIEHHEGMVPSFEPRGLSSRHLELQSAICRLACKSRDNGGSLIFRIEDLRRVTSRTGEALHLSLSGWAPKQGKAEGRWTNNPDVFNNVPSRAEAQERVKRKYRRSIENPTIQQIVERLLHLEGLMEEGALSPEDATERCLTLLKSDLKGAFTLLDLRPESALLQCYEIGHGLVAICLRGTFGTVELPFAFFIISELLEMAGRALGRRALGSSSRFDLAVYVDDFCGGMISRRREVAHIVKEGVFKPLLGLVRVLLGPDSVELKKTVFGTVLDFLGWRVDAEKRTIRMSDRTQLKLVYHLSCIEGARAKGTTMEVVASLAERMSCVAPLLRIFLPFLYSSYCYLRCKEATVSLQGLALTAVYVVKTMTYAQFRRPAYSFDALRPRSSSWRVQFDGSNKGVGAAIYRRENGAETLRGQISLPLPGELATTLDVQDRVQNGCELLAAMVGILAVALLDEEATVALTVRGDSEVVARHWLKDGRFKGEPGMRAALAVVIVEHHRDLRVVEHLWCSKHDNTHCDDLSRMRPIQPHPGAWVVSSEPCPENLLPIRRLVDLCNPWIALQSPLDTPEKLERFLSELSDLLPIRS